MTIKLYKIPDDRKQVDKTIIDIGVDATILGTLSNVHIKENTNILKPTIEIAYNSLYATANYMYVPEWRRYYHLEPPTVGAQRMFFQGSVDVLYTYRTGIRALQVIVERQEEKSKGKLYMVDKAFKSEVRKIISTRKLSGAFDKAHSSYILTTGGRS